jgi:hypothetical protein
MPRVVSCGAPQHLFAALAFASSESHVPLSPSFFLKPVNSRLDSSGIHRWLAMMAASRERGKKMYSSNGLETNVIYRDDNLSRLRSLPAFSDALKRTSSPFVLANSPI